MDILKDHILQVLQKDSTPRKLAHLEQELGVHGAARTAFREAVDSLCAQGRVIVGPGHVVRLPSLAGEVTGIFRANARGYGFVTPEQADAEEEVFIPTKSTGSAMTGDRVVAKITRRGARGDDNRLTAQIVRVLDRAHTAVVGTLRQESNGWQVQPDGGDFTRPVEIEAVDARKVRPGDKVAVEIRLYPTRSQPARGVIAEVLGRPGRFDAETAAVIRRHGLHDAFDASSLVEASNAKMGFEAEARLDGRALRPPLAPARGQDRQDLTGERIITIDPPDAKDFDDAVSLTRDDKGRWVLGVHVADVSHFVPVGSALDRAARLRGNSVYLPGRTLPMLPEMLSNGICSLQPGRPRYTKSVYLTYNQDGRVQFTRFANTIIQSRARLTYQEADRILQGNADGFADEVVSLLHDMETLARLIESRRRRAGMLQLKMAEQELVRDESGQVVDIQPEDTSYPHTIIEMFMVEANVAVARLLDRYCIPFLRRIHPEPNSRALRQLAQTLRLLGVAFSRRPQRSDLQKLLDRVQGMRIALPVNILVLRSLEVATYAPVSVGHYALAASKYCHFTSPIRRYADLTVHRALQAYLAGDLEHARRQYTFGELEEIGQHITESEQAAEEAERELKTIFILHLLRNRLGPESVARDEGGAAANGSRRGREGRRRCASRPPRGNRIGELCPELRSFRVTRSPGPPPSEGGTVKANEEQGRDGHLQRDSSRLGTHALATSEHGQDVPATREKGQEAPARQGQGPKARDTLDGIVVSLTAFGASVHLPEYGVEGLIPREALGPDHWQFDEQNQCVVGRYSGAILRLAQTLRVRIVGVHPTAGQLDLAPAHPVLARAPDHRHRPRSRPRHSQRHRRTKKP